MSASPAQALQPLLLRPVPPQHPHARLQALRAGGQRRRRLGSRARQQQRRLAASSRPGSRRQGARRGRGGGHKRDGAGRGRHAAPHRPVGGRAAGARRDPRASTRGGALDPCRGAVRGPDGSCRVQRTLNPRAQVSGDCLLLRHCVGSCALEEREQGKTGRWERTTRGSGP